MKVNYKRKKEIPRNSLINRNTCVLPFLKQVIHGNLETEQAL